MIEKNKLGFFKYKSTLRSVIIIIFIITILFVYFGINEKNNQQVKNKKILKTSTKFKSEGGGMEYYGFNKNNEKTLKIICDKSEETKDNKIYMKNIVATFTPKSRVKNEVKISGREGLVENNLYNFIITGGAKIQSKDFLIESSALKLENKDVLSSNKSLKYNAKNLSGNAKSMKIHLENSLISFFDTSGLYKTKDKIVKYKTARLHINDNKQAISFKKLKKKNIVWGNDFSITGERILTQFTEDYKTQIYTHVRHDCHFIMKKIISTNPELIEHRSIKAKYINLEYTDTGDIFSINSRLNTKVELKNDSYLIDISTNVFYMDFFEESQTIKSISLKSPENEFLYKDLKDDRKEDFQLKGTEINLKYNEAGKISEWEVVDKENTYFISDRYYCNGGNIKYKLIDKTVLIKNNAKVEIDKKNIFKSEEFLIKTEKRILSSTKPVIANIQLKQKSVLLSTKPIYITSNSMIMDEEKSFMNFNGNVFLIQNDVSIKTDKLIISEKNGIKCKSKLEKQSIITFNNNNKEIVINGRLIEFNKEKKTINIVGEAILKDEDNKIKGDNLLIHFNNDGIYEIIGKGNILFKKIKMIIEAESVKWLYDKNIAFFNKLKQIKQKETGSIKGKRIKLNLKTNKMTVISENEERTEMVLD